VCVCVLLADHVMSLTLPLSMSDPLRETCPIDDLMGKARSVHARPEPPESAPTPFFARAKPQGWKGAQPLRAV
jgi:hypothetical protein